MHKPKVFFADIQAIPGESLPEKLMRLIRAAGFGDIDFQRKYVAIKMHFDERGNMAFLRRSYARVMADAVWEAGGLPFLTDANTLNMGGRKNALDHMDTAYQNGFSPFSTGCHILIADGLKGNDEALVPVPNGELVKEAKIGRAMMDADVVVSLTHFKCHELTGIGGALKNLGMGCGSRAGKLEIHSASKPMVNEANCSGCGECRKSCANGALKIAGGKAVIDRDRCVGCGRCVPVCSADAVGAKSDETNDLLCKKMAEYCAAVLHDRPQFHISLVIDVLPFCDYYSENDAPIVTDIGMFASFDPVALDVACAQAVNKRQPFPGSLLDGCQRHGKDHFHSLFPDTNWWVSIEHAEKLGVGSSEYELVEI